MFSVVDENVCVRKCYLPTDITELNTTTGEKVEMSNYFILSIETELFSHI